MDGLRPRANSVLDEIQKMFEGGIQASPISTSTQAQMQRGTQFGGPQMAMGMIDNQPTRATVVPVGDGFTAALQSPAPVRPSMLTTPQIPTTRINPPKVTPARQIPDMGGAGVRMTPDQLAEQAAKAVELEERNPEVKADPGFMSTVKDFFGNRENMLLLAAGFNSMRLNPDAGLASLIGSELETIRAKKLIDTSANKTIQSLKSIGTPDALAAAKLIEANPSSAKTVLSEYVKKSMEGDEELFKDEGDLRKEYTGNATVKNYSEQSSAFGRVIASAKNPSAAGDLALIFNFMKVLDPGSVVREGEFATAQNAAGVPGQVRSFYNRVARGERLNPEQRDDFVNRALALYEQATSEYQSIRDKYEDIAGQYGYNVERTIPDFYAQNENMVNPTITYDQLDAQTKSQFPNEAAWNQYFNSKSYLEKLEMMEML